LGFFAGILLAPSNQMKGGNAVTFGRPISALMVRKCAPCHRPEGPAPFSLVTYRDVQKRIEQINRVVKLGVMPPQNGMSDFGMVAWQERLTDEESQLLLRWMQAGAPEGAGEPAPIPAFPKWRPRNPSIVLYSSPSKAVPGEGAPFWQRHLVKYTGQDSSILGFDFVPKNPKAVRAAIVSFHPQRTDLPETNWLGTWAMGYPSWMLPSGASMPISNGDLLAVDVLCNPKELVSSRC
jgi:hypothetical protein